MEAKVRTAGAELIVFENARRGMIIIVYFARHGRVTESERGR
jgi:hypothetical protein